MGRRIAGACVCVNGPDSVYKYVYSAYYLRVMSTPVSQFDYVLPPERIAQTPMEPRDHSRLLVLDRHTGAYQHKTFFEIADELHAGDVLVVNKTKVFKARLHGRRFAKAFEVFLLRPEADAFLPGSSIWHALVRPGKLVHVGNYIDLGGGLSPTVTEKRPDGSVLLSFDVSKEEVFAFAEKYGQVPTPPYVKETPEASAAYQTVYAEQTGSVAAPTAGFHFTPELIATLKGKGVQIETVVLHVGLGTFRPMKTETIEEHEMHAEYVEIDAVTARSINQAKQEGRRIVAVGTTTVRALEGAALLATDPGLPASGFTGDVNMFITPGFTFKVVDALITNFHLPKSTLLVLVSAFAGREHVLAAYQEAIAQGYRFYSFGDAMFIR